LLVQWEVTDRQAVLEALAALGPHTRKIIGVILSQVATGWYRLFNNGGYAGYSESAPTLVPAADQKFAPSLAPVSNVVATGGPTGSGNVRVKSAGFRLD
jgi:hypothetical protein